MIAGMDFGTTHSGMAVYDDQQLRMIPLNARSPNDRVTPTVLYITNEQQISFGSAATSAYFEQNLGRPSKMEKVWVGEITQTFAELPTFVKDVYIWVDVLSPGRLFLSFKTDLSDSSYTGTAIGRFFYTLEDITTAYLYTAKRRAESLLGRELDEIVLGRPVRFNTNPEADKLAQARLLEAALQAGYKKVYFEYEPVAAAYYYESTLSRPQNVLVFDFGGGTLDVTIMRLGDPRRREVLATGGVPIAGDVFDRKIVRAKIPRHFGEGSHYRSMDKWLPLPAAIFEAFQDWRTLLTLQQPEHMNTLRTIAPSAEKRHELQALIQLVTSNYSLKLFEVVEQVKRRLSERNEAVIRLQGDGFTIREPITRSEFEQIIRPEHNIIERHVEETLAASGLRADEIDVVIRTGGSSQIPMFQRMLAQKFGEEKVKAIDTFGSVTAGLGLIGHRLVRGEIEKPAYTQSTKLTLPAADARTNIPAINLDLLKQQIAWQEGDDDGQAHAPGLTLLSRLRITGQPAAVKLFATNAPGALVELSLELARAPLALLYTPVDTPLLLITSAHRMVLLTVRDLLQQRAAGLTLFDLYGFERAEQICLLQPWAAIRDQSAFVLVSTQGYARKFDMAQLRPAIEGPTPTKLDWTLPGWPRLALGAAEEDEIVLVTALGRGVRMPVAAIRRTGTRVLHKSKADDLVGGCATSNGAWLWLLASEGYAKWLPVDAIPLSEDGGSGAVIVRRRGELCGVMKAPDKPLHVLTTTRLASLDPGATPPEDAVSQSMHKLLKLAKGEQVLGTVQAGSVVGS